VWIRGCIFAVLAAAGCASVDPLEDQLPAAFTPGKANSTVHMVSMPNPKALKGVVPALGEPNDNCAPWRPNPNPEATHAFVGVEPFELHEVTIRANQMHAAPVAGKNCLSCHTGQGKAPAFDFAGTIYTSVAGTTPAANTEVRVIRPDGLFATVHADTDGNFWHKGPVLAPAGSMTGVRNANGQFVGHLNGPACNSCHLAGNRLYIK